MTENSTGAQPFPAALVERHGRVLVITLNRPDARNAINSEMTSIIIAALAELDNDDGLSVGVLTGAGSGFCSGMDLKEFADKGTPQGLDALLRNGSVKPLIAAVDGFVLAGGLELALICDLIVATARTKFGIPETKVGLFAAGGGVIRLPQRLPYAIAAEMGLTAAPIDAETALRHGLVNRVVGDGEAVTDAAMDLAAVIARNAPLALRASKQIMRQASSGDEGELWKAQIPLIKQVFTSSDAKEGPQAFAQKRNPEWSGS